MMNSIVILKWYEPWTYLTIYKDGEPFDWYDEEEHVWRNMEDIDD